MRVLIAGCIRQPTKILEAFLDGLETLEKPFDYDYYFIENGLDEEAHVVLNEWAEMNDAEIKENTMIIPYKRDGETHHWNVELINHVIQMKNRILEKAQKGKYDYLFFTDSDQVFHPRTLIHLISLKKHIIGEICWTRWRPQSEPMPNAWLRHPYEFDGRMLELREPAVHEVKGFGGCYLLDREILDSDISFSRVAKHPSWGEDRYFALNAEKIGYKLYVDATYPYFHIYRTPDLEPLREWIKNGYKEPPIKLREGSLLIAICIGEKEIHAETLAWITRTLLRHHDWGLEISRGHPIDSNRNSVVRKFMLLPEAQKYEWLLFLDTDVVPPNGAAERLLSYGKKIVGGVCLIMGKTGMPVPNVSKDISPGYVKAELMEVKGMGTGFMLIHREVLEAVGKSPFRFRYDKWGTASICGEDYDFCEKAVKAGYKIYADFGVQCEHYKTVGLLQLNRKLSSILTKETQT